MVPMQDLVLAHALLLRGRERRDQAQHGQRRQCLELHAVVSSG
jgi:hypothetical protein